MCATKAQGPAGRNGSVLLTGSHAICEPEQCQLPVDCDKSKTGTINPKPTTRMIEQSYS